MSSNYNSLLEKIRNHQFTIAVVGLGRVGLPLACVYAVKGVNVIGVDVNSDLVDKISKLDVPFKEAFLDDYLKDATKRGKLKTTTDLSSAIKQADVIIITVGTPITEDFRPDYSQFYSALEDVTQNLHSGVLMIIRSTVPPKTVEGITKQLVESTTGYTLDKEFWLATCPERICEGKAIEELLELPEIIGGTSEASSFLAAELFKILNPRKKMLLTNSCIAELAKLFTNAYRYVNFALANEFGIIAEECGVDGREVIRIANEGYKRGGIPLPGLTGGPCLSKDGYFLTESFSYTDLIRVAWNLNESIPGYIIRKIKNILNRPLLKMKATVLGIAYKAAVDDTRYSPAMKLVNYLKMEGCDVRVHDPYIQNTLSLRDASKEAELVILAMNHPEFKKLVIKDLANLVKKDCLVMDCWGIWNADEVRKCGLRYTVFGGA